MDKIKLWYYFNKIKYSRFFTPVVVFCYAFVLFIVSSMCGLGYSINDYRLSLLLSDFTPYFSNGFVCFYDYEIHTLFYPNGESISLGDYDVKRVLGLSQNRILTSRFGNDDSTTDIVISDLDMNNSKILYTFDDDYGYADVLNDKKVLIYKDYHKEYDGYLLDIEDGIIEPIDQSYSITKMINLQGSFEKQDKEYLIKIPGEESFTFNQNVIDSNALKLINKWKFKPFKCRKMLNDNYCCSYYRDTNTFDSKKICVFLMELSKGSEIISYQFFLPKNWFSTHYLMYDVRDSISESLILID